MNLKDRRFRSKPNFLGRLFYNDAFKRVCHDKPEENDHVHNILGMLDLLAPQDTIHCQECVRNDFHRAPQPRSRFQRENGSQAGPSSNGSPAQSPRFNQAVQLGPKTTGEKSKKRKTGGLCARENGLILGWSNLPAIGFGCFWKFAEKGAFLLRIQRDWPAIQR